MYEMREMYGCIKQISYHTYILYSTHIHTLTHLSAQTYHAAWILMYICGHPHLPQDGGGGMSISLKKGGSGIAISLDYTMSCNIVVCYTIQ